MDKHSLFDKANAVLERIGYMWMWAAISVVLLLMVLPLNPVLAGSYIWAAAKMSMAAAAGYGFDWAAFRHDDPKDKVGIEKTMAQTRRATIIAAALIAAGLIG